jgi:hypothetical protein
VADPVKPIKPPCIPFPGDGGFKKDATSIHKTYIVFEKEVTRYFRKQSRKEYDFPKSIS